MLKNKIAVITGGTRGIGFVIAETFLKNGAKVAIFGSRQETVDKAVEKLRAENSEWEVIGFCPNLSDYSEVESAINQFKEKFGITPTEYAKSVR